MSQDIYKVIHAVVRLCSMLHDAHACVDAGPLSVSDEQIESGRELQTVNVMLVQQQNKAVRYRMSRAMRLKIKI